MSTQLSKIVAATLVVTALAGAATSAQGFKWWQDERFKRELALSGEQIERLEVHHLASAGSNLTYALLSDGIDADQEILENDEPLLTVADEAIAQLNRRYALFFAKQTQRFTRYAQQSTTTELSFASVVVMIVVVVVVVVVFFSFCINKDEGLAAPGISSRIAIAHRLIASSPP